MRASMLAWVLMFAAAVPCAAESPPPVSAFARLPNLRGVALSPDGSKLVALAAITDLTAAMVIDLATGSATPVLASQRNGFQINWCDWANDTRILCGYRGLDFEADRYFQLTRLVGVNVDGSKQKVLMQGTRLGGRTQFQDQVLAWTPEEPRSVLIEASEDGDQFPEIYELDVYSGVMRLRHSEREPYISYYADARGEVRLAQSSRSGIISWYARASGTENWTELSRYRLFKDVAVDPVGFGAETHRFYALAPHEGRDALWLVDLEDRSAPELVFSHPLVDVYGPITDVDDRFLGVHYETDMPFAHYTDGASAALIDAARKALPNQFVVLGDRTRDGKVSILRAMSDVQSSTYYVFDQRAMQLRPLGSQYPELDKAVLAKMRPVSYKARDGARIPGYLTTPVGVAAERIPMVIMPHGGPIARDSWGFDFLVQFLASRGYGVLQMNFRGSSGYGVNWFHAAHQDWGGVTYDDIVDGAKWAVETGVADPERVCIVGWSFGGYAALLGAARDSGLFRCSASIAGVSDLKQLITEGRFFTNHRLLKEQVGRDEEKLERDSPRRHAKNVGIPVLLVHGRRDPVVTDEHSRYMANALESAGKDVEYLRLEHADHAIDDVPSRTALLQKLESFLTKHLAAPVAAAAPAEGANAGITYK